MLNNFVAQNDEKSIFSRLAGNFWLVFATPWQWEGGREAQMALQPPHKHSMSHFISFASSRWLLVEG